MGLLKNKINSGKPFMLTRYGFNELRCISPVATNKIRERVFKNLCTNAGFFPEDISLLEKFREICNDAERNINILLPLWSSDYKFRERFRIMKHSNIGYLLHNSVAGDCLGYSGRIDKNSWGSFEYFMKNSWFSALEGKKVLLVHPNEESILSQYDKLQKAGLMIKFEKLSVVKTSYTNTYNLENNGENRFHDWFEVLENLQHMISMVDFDVAILGCGCYGMPLASFVKNLGKQALHLGGATQLLFAITGNRWVNEFHKVFPEDFWVYPLESERPMGFKKIEGGCY